LAPDAAVANKLFPMRHWEIAGIERAPEGVLVALDWSVYLPGARYQFRKGD